MRWGNKTVHSRHLDALKDTLMVVLWSFCPQLGTCIKKISKDDDDDDGSPNSKIIHVCTRRKTPTHRHSHLQSAPFHNVVMTILFPTRTKQSTNSLQHDSRTHSIIPTRSNDDEGRRTAVCSPNRRSRLDCLLPGDSARDSDETAAKSQSFTPSWYYTPL